MEDHHRDIRIALVGNPNLGKTTLFNSLCGLRQKTGNYPGVTVDKNTGIFEHQSQQIELIDLPGITSLFPKSKDEELVVEYLMNNQDEDFPDKLIVLASALNLKRSLYLIDQIRDLNIPVVLAINYAKKAQKRGIFIDEKQLSEDLDIPVVLIDANEKHNLDKLKDLVLEDLEVSKRPIHYLPEVEHNDLQKFANEIKQEEYKSFLLLITNARASFDQYIETHQLNTKRWRTNESILRYRYIKTLVEKSVQVDKFKAEDFTTKADRILVHPVWGYVIFAFIMFSIFQAIFLLATFPMDWIDAGFAQLSAWTTAQLPSGYFSDLITQGLIPGIGGVVIFVPQIAILFILFAILEESGYMTRIVYLMDNFMQRFGMSGKSVVPMISGMACAVPAIMSARTIESRKERLITIMITPLMTCSARIPVYVVIIALIVPDDLMVARIFHAQGLVLMGMYFLGIFMTLIVAFVMKQFIKSDFKSYLVIDMPEYLLPEFKSVLISAWNNVKSFLWNAGRIILASSIILFVLATNGGEDFRNAEQIIEQRGDFETTAEKEAQISSFQLENSYLGLMGRSIEPAIAPLGYDWKIGIALISSLAAREVFVSTISTIYAIDSEEEMKIRDRLKKERRSDGSFTFGLATSISLLIFYAFALQCLSTVAVTYKETKSLRWTLFQFAYMTALAYFAAMAAYQLIA